MVIAGNDQVNLSGEGQSKYFIIIGIAGHYAGCWSGDTNIRSARYCATSASTVVS